MSNTLKLAIPQTVSVSARGLAPLEVCELSPDLHGAWQAYVASAPSATLFHELGWMRAVQKAYGHKPRYLLARTTAGAVRGVLPLFQVKGPLTGKAIISVPYAVYGGIAAEDSTAERALAEAAKSLAHQSGARYLELRQDLPSLGGQSQSHYYTFRGTLPKETKDVLDRFPRKARAAIRHARDRFGLRAEFGPQLLGVFYNGYLRSLRRLGSPPHGLRFLRLLQEEFQDRCQVQVVYQGQEPVAGVLSFFFQNQVLPYYAAVDERYSRLNTSNFMYFALMEQAVSRGLEIFDFGRTRCDNESGCQFKINQGFEPQPLPYTFYAPSGEQPPDLRPSNPRFSWPRAVWKRLPLSTTALLGGFLSRWLP